MQPPVTVLCVPQQISYSNHSTLLGPQNSSSVSCIFLQIFSDFNPYPTAFPNGNGMVLHFYQQQESSTTKTVHKVINKGLKAYV